MKEVKIERVVYDYKYEAVDGTEFSDKEECEKYEKSAIGVLKTRLDKITLKKSDEESMLHTGNCDTNMYAVIPQSTEDIDMLKQLSLLLGRNDVEKISDNWIDRVILVYIGYNNDWIYIDTLDDLVKRITYDTWMVVINPAIPSVG